MFSNTYPYDSMLIPNGAFIPSCQQVGIRFPKFNGTTDPRDWIWRAEEYFMYYCTPESQKLMIASVHMEGGAMTWYVKNMSIFTDWSIFIWALDMEFNVEYQRMKKLYKQSNYSQNKFSETIDMHQSSRPLLHDAQNRPDESQSLRNTRKQNFSPPQEVTPNTSQLVLEQCLDSREQPEEICFQSPMISQGLHLLEPLVLPPPHPKITSLCKQEPLPPKSTRPHILKYLSNPSLLNVSALSMNLWPLPTQHVIGTHRSIAIPPEPPPVLLVSVLDHPPHFINQKFHVPIELAGATLNHCYYCQLQFLNVTHRCNVVSDAFNVGFDQRSCRYKYVKSGQSSAFVQWQLNKEAGTFTKLNIKFLAGPLWTMFPRPCWILHSFLETMSLYMVVTHATRLQLLFVITITVDACKLLDFNSVWSSSIDSFSKGNMSSRQRNWATFIISNCCCYSQFWDKVKLLFGEPWEPGEYVFLHRHAIS